MVWMPSYKQVPLHMCYQIWLLCVKGLSKKTGKPQICGALELRSGAGFPYPLSNPAQNIRSTVAICLLPS